MGAQIISTIISGAFSIAAALGSILMKLYVDRPQAPESMPPAANVINPYDPPTLPEMHITPRPTESLTEPTLLSRQVLLIPITTVVVGTVLGIVARLLRPYANISGTHYETLAALIILLVGCLVLVNFNRLIHGVPGHLLFQLENLAMWSGYACGWSLIHGHFWGDLIGMSIAWWSCCSVFGSVLLAIFQRKRSRTVAS